MVFAADFVQRQPDLARALTSGKVESLARESLSGETLNLTCVTDPFNNTTTTTVQTSTTIMRKVVIAEMNERKRKMQQNEEGFITRMKSEYLLGSSHC